ncbi:MAG: TfoX/Sxy family protein [Pirellulales bacterium]|nr:TfoX/Sxy family protein [Pirellulales bacterium]
MAYDAQLAARVDRVLTADDGFESRRMFGGIGYLLRGNMCVGVYQDTLIVRVGPDAYEAALAEPEVRKFDITGKPLRGWVMLTRRGVASEAALRRWIGRALSFVEHLPPKGLAQKSPRPQVRRGRKKKN